MLLPRFSIRWILLFTAVVATLLLMIRRALAGEDWAIAMAATLGLIVAVFALYGVVFLSAYGLARATRMLTPAKTTENPFVVEGQFPPQEVPKNPHGNETF